MDQHQLKEGLMNFDIYDVLKMSEKLQHSRVDLASIATDEDYTKALLALFKRRGVAR